MSLSLITTYLIKNDPALLQRRLRGGPLAEGRPAQRVIMWLVSVALLRSWLCLRSIIAFADLEFH
jgi:hypothetical protein